MANQPMSTTSTSTQATASVASPIPQPDPSPTPSPANKTKTVSNQSVKTVPKEKNFITSAKEIKSSTKRFLILSGLLFLLLSFANIGLIIYSNRQTRLYRETLTQITASRQGNINLQEAMQFIQTGEVQIDLILNTLPGNETELVDFVRAVETIGRNHTTNLSLKFNTAKPTGSEGEKHLPLKITLTSDLVNFIEFLKKYEKLPYILELVSIESEKVFDSDTLWNFQILANVYIREPFNQ